MNKKISILFCFLLIILLSLTASAQVEIGGEAEVNSIITIDDTPEFYLDEKLNIKLYIPETKNTEVKVDFDIRNSQFGVSTNFKKLYIKRNFNNFNLTLGKQPISWSFGSLLNPVDFNFGAEIMDESTSVKYIDAAKVYLPFNWKTGVEIIANPQSKVDHSKLKYEGTKSGIRARTMIKDYDLSLNYIYDPTIELDNRLGLSLKGDLGPLGVYSAVSYEKNEDKQNEEQTYLLGLDYSKSINYDQRIYFQGEIINLSSTKISSIAPSFSENNFDETINFADERHNLFLGNISYTLNDFSSLNFMMVGNINNNNLIFIPQYNNQLPGNIDMTIRGTITSGKNAELLNMPGSINVNLKYSF
ncbi:MAG: hypothetical protein ACQEQD_06455 [Bacillota bacterium]